MKRLIDEEDVIRAICKNCYAEDGGDYKDCRYYPCDDVQAIEALPSTDLERIKAIMKKANEQDKQMGRPTDIISRADAMDAVDRIKSTDNWQGAVIALLSALPSAEAVQGWIPCSERLPNVGENVLFTTDIYGGYVAEGNIRADGKWWQYRWNALLQNDEVTAWMPLPKPYKGGDE